jgi:hypothetical protein
MHLQNLLFLRAGGTDANKKRSHLTHHAKTEQSESEDSGMSFTIEEIST